MKKLMPLMVLPFIILIGCSKEELAEQNNPTNNQFEGFMPLAVGNYWVYETYIIDPMGNETLSGNLDSAYVSRDTSIAGNTYYIVEGSTMPTSRIGTIIRNKNNSIVNYDNSDGSDYVLFTTNNLGSILSLDTVNSTPGFEWIMTTWINPSSVAKAVGAGLFYSYDKETEIEIVLPLANAGIKKEHTYYHQDVGVVSFQYNFLSSPNINEARLIRYNIN